jgi:hypothetical protein
VLLVAVTMTMARGADEEALIARALRHASEAGFTIVACDSGSRAEFVEDIRALPRTTVLLSPVRGLVAQITYAMAAAIDRGATRIFYAEPDKDVFLERHATRFVEAARQNADSVHVAARTSRALATFPPIQQFTERTINTLTSDVVGVSGDYSYGPMLLPVDAAKYTLQAPERIGWGWRHFVLARARRAGIAVALHAGDYECPPAQRGDTDTERIHRLKQLAQNIDGLVEGLTSNT